MTTQNLPAVKAAPQPTKIQILKQTLQSPAMLGKLAKALPNKMSPDRLTAVVVNLASKTPKILECSPGSILNCIVDAGSLGLELSPVMGQAYLVPRKGQAQLQVGYRGLTQLAFRSGQVSNIIPRVVHKGDEFYYEYGSKPYVKHIPCDEPGEATHYYCVVVYKDGSADFEVMTAAEIERHAKQYSESIKYDNSPWHSAKEEMSKKVPLRRLMKRTPMAVDAQLAAVLDEYAEAGVSQHTGREIDFTETELLPAPQSRTEALEAELMAEDEARAKAEGGGK